jgi:hypothetical protein
LKEELQKLKGFESGMDKGVTFMLGHIKMLKYTPLNCMETGNGECKFYAKKLLYMNGKTVVQMKHKQET